MYTSRKKIHKDKDVEPTEFEESVAQVCKPGCLLCLLILVRWLYIANVIQICFSEGYI